MEKLKHFAKKYYFKELGLILLFSLLLFFLYYGKTESFLVDSGREVYLPLKVLEGKVLYKDLFNVYGPLSYQINAIAYAVFGTNLNTLYWMGFLNSLIILFSIFFITKMFVSRKTALCVTSLVIVGCVYVKTFFNFIFPYSYAAVYALSGFLLSALCSMIYIRQKKSFYLFCAFFFAGFSFANKIEYAPYFLFLFIWLFFVKPGWKNTLYSICAFFSVPIVSTGILLLQGASFGDLWNGLKLIQNIVKTPALNYFYTNYGLYISPMYFKYAMITLGKLSVFLFPFTLILYGLNLLSKKYLHEKSLKIFYNISLGAALLFVSFKVLFIYLTVQMRFFTWIGIVCTLVLIGFGLFFFDSLRKKDSKKTAMNKKDLMYIFFLISSILVSFKGLTAVGSECYGTFSLAVLLVSFTIFFVRYLPRLMKFVDKKIWTKTIHNVFFVVIFLVFAGTFKAGMETPLYPVHTERGLIFVKPAISEVNNMIQYIKKNTPENAKIVTAPEGALINFLSGRDTDDKYYYLIPVNVQLFGEENIINDFKRNPPDYFLLNSLPYYCFNTSNICSYAQELCKFINDNYVLDVRTRGDVAFYLYKKTEKSVF